MNSNIISVSGGSSSGCWFETLVAFLLYSLLYKCKIFFRKNKRRHSIFTIDFQCNQFANRLVDSIVSLTNEFAFVFLCRFWNIKRSIHQKSIIPVDWSPFIKFQHRMRLGCGGWSVICSIVIEFSAMSIFGITRRLKKWAWID